VAATKPADPLGTDIAQLHSSEQQAALIKVSTSAHAKLDACLKHYSTASPLLITSYDQAYLPVAQSWNARMKLLGWKQRVVICLDAISCTASHAAVSRRRSSCVVPYFSNITTTTPPAASAGRSLLEAAGVPHQQAHPHRLRGRVPWLTGMAKFDALSAALERGYDCVFSEMDVLWTSAARAHIIVALSDAATAPIKAMTVYNRDFNLGFLTARSTPATRAFFRTMSEAWASKMALKGRVGAWKISKKATNAGKMLATDQLVFNQQLYFAQLANGTIAAELDPLHFARHKGNPKDDRSKHAWVPVRQTSGGQKSGALAPPAIYHMHWCAL
jgi:hypothetical protein